MKIAKALKSSKTVTVEYTDETQSTIKIETKKTRVILTYNNLILNFSKIEAREIGEKLTKSVGFLAIRKINTNFWAPYIMRDKELKA